MLLFQKHFTPTELKHTCCPGPFLQVSAFTKCLGVWRVCVLKNATHALTNSNAMNDQTQNLFFFFSNCYYNYHHQRRSRPLSRQRQQATPDMSQLDRSNFRIFKVIFNSPNLRPLMFCCPSWSHFEGQKHEIHKSDDWRCIIYHSIVVNRQEKAGEWIWFRADRESEVRRGSCRNATEKSRVFNLALKLTSNGRWIEVKKHIFYTHNVSDANSAKKCFQQNDICIDEMSAPRHDDVKRRAS